MANSENSDVRVLVGVDPASASLIEKDILDLLSKISEKKYKVKIQADVSQVEKEIKKITQKKGSNTFNLTSANKEVEKISTNLKKQQAELQKLTVAGNKVFSDSVTQTQTNLEDMLTKFKSTPDSAKKGIFADIKQAAENATTAITRMKDSTGVITSLGSNIEKLEKRVAKKGLGKYGDDFSNQMKSILTKYEDFKRRVASGAIDLNTDTARSELKKLVDEFDRVLQSEKSITSASGFGTRIAKEATTAKMSLASLIDQFTTIKGVLGKSTLGLTTKYFATRALWKVKQSMELVYQNVVKIDSALAQLQIVTGASGNQLEIFFDSAAESAKNLGTTVTEMLSSIETFSRLGYGLEDSLTLSSAATIMSNTAAVNVDEATTGITAIIKGYGLQVEDSERVTDVLVEVGRKYAISAGELMEAFQRGGAALYATGTDFEKSAALFAAANASIQNASTVGTALKAVSARIRGAKSELEEMGEDATDVAEGFSKYREEIMALTNVGGSGGFDIMANVDTGEYKDIYEIFVGLSEVWDQLSDTTQARVAEILGGTRQLSVISSILNNIGDATGAYADAIDAAGTATEANAIVMETAEKKIEQFKTTFETMSRSILDDDLVKGTIDFGTGFLEFLDKVIDKIGALPVLFAGAGIIDLVKHFGNSNEFAPYGCEAIAA